MPLFDGRKMSRYKCFASNYGLSPVYKGFETHKLTCRKCGVELHHPLGVAFVVCVRCGNTAFEVRWNHIEDLICRGRLSLNISTKSVEKLRENVKDNLIQQKVLYEDWSDSSVIQKKIPNI